MNEHVGASFSLSVLIVVVSAVILYEPEPASPQDPADTAQATASATPHDFSPGPADPVDQLELDSSLHKEDDALARSDEAHDDESRQPAEIEKVEVPPEILSSNTPVPPRVSSALYPAMPGPVAPVSRLAAQPTQEVLSRNAQSDLDRSSANRVASVASALPPTPPETIEPAPVPRTPQSAFTRVEKNESLSDIALRVYGTPEAAAELWLVNRDILNNRENPLRAGLYIRTP